MKKFAIMTVLSMLLSNAVWAEGFNPNTPISQQQKSDKRPTLPLSTLKEALRAPDNTMVRLQGKLTKHAGQPNHYIFEDDTSSIKMSIAPHIWNGQEANPSNIIEVIGEVDVDPWSTEIKVKQLWVLK